MLNEKQYQVLKHIREIPAVLAIVAGGCLGGVAVLFVVSGQYCRTRPPKAAN